MLPHVFRRWVAIPGEFLLMPIGVRQREALASSRRSTSASVRVQFAAERLSRSCFSLRAPMMTVSTPGLRVTQFSATCEMETPRGAELQWTPGHNARTLVAGGHDFMFGVAGQQRIVDLLRDIARNSEPVRDGQGFSELPARVIGATGVAKLPARIRSSKARRVSSRGLRESKLWA